VPRLILLLAVIAVLYILLKRASTMPPHKRKAEYVKIGLGIAVVAVVILTFAGKMHWVGAAFTGLLVAMRQLLPTLVRLFPMLASLKGQGAAKPGQASTVESAILRMQLDHDTGNLEGEVLQGQFKGWRLADMTREQLESLLQYCQREDSDSTQLLQSYLEQRFPGEGPFGQQQSASASNTDMNRAEALAVLGLGEDATEEEIVGAHRKLMQKMHPDRGGSDYLAAKINQAKDFLLG